MSTFLSLLMILGSILLVAACTGLFYYGRRYLVTPEGKRLIARISGMKVADEVDVEDVNVLRTDVLPASASNVAKMDVVEPGNVITYTTDFSGGDSVVTASMTLTPKTQEMFGERRWVTKPEGPSKAVWVGNEWIFRIPSAEGGNFVWMKGTLIPTLGSLADFYKGDDNDPGPAKLFKNLGQNIYGKEIVYSLPGGLTQGTQWRVHDIGKFFFDVEGNTDGIVYDGDRTFFVTSRQMEGTDWLFYIDARDEARGRGGLFRCTPFDPEMDIKQLF
ncbi:MAG: hypothetical protein GW762_01460 [Candidatus Pacebacteria bacterium]|nr:hypothetical protein [Candidatus Paceibacterota bacterium]PIR64213.1 MAG: hypothetical protein COU64_00660 [Candidatus Pacebacteria bacterium CG10_big_fil_rev_8_21_14_0_10_40_26]PIZ79262.1 MAG: hypothetical protein COY01_02460 [Candidatus Pacebacteria bacterium CG_4_10_14_0_2_um_filter_40_20]PJC42229.1 MAG: hypothetical protein CO041_01170 [Candidatus Pacebacteria bacterium CG_4_9_14_0_2_um_filter_40_15]